MNIRIFIRALLSTNHRFWDKVQRNPIKAYTQCKTPCNIQTELIDVFFQDVALIFGKLIMVQPILFLGSLTLSTTKTCEHEIYVYMIQSKYNDTKRSI